MTLIHLFCDETSLQHVFSGIPSIILLLILVLSIIILSKGADWMIDGVVAFARRTGLPKVFIGATIVSLGTTTPEAFVSVMAAWMGNPGLALGNGVGSIIADTGLIFGLSCMIAPIPINRFILNRTGWIQVVSATLLVAVALIAAAIMPAHPVLSRQVGVFFLLLLAVYLYLTYRWSKKGCIADISTDETFTEGDVSAIRSLVMIVGGLVLVIVGARVLIPAAAEIAHRIGVPNDIIAATMVAFGTSTPELITAISAIRKGHPEITVGNIVGADVLNCLFVIGAAATARPLHITTNFFIFHFPAMLLILYSFRLFISLNRKDIFYKWQGMWLFALYIVYIVLQYTLGIGGGTS